MGHHPHALREPVRFLPDDLGGVPHRDIVPRLGLRTRRGRADALRRVRHHRFQGWKFLAEAHVRDAGITVPRLPTASFEGYAVCSVVFGLWGNHPGV